MIKLLKDFGMIYITILLTLFACNSNGQKVDNTKPLYGEVPKSDEYKKIDEDFKKECLEKFKTIDSAVNVHIDQAWRYFYNNDLKTSMKRFNQAWLLNPEFPDAYFGFAALLEMQESKTEAQRFYKIGLDKDKKNRRAEICYRRIADCKEQLKNLGGAIEAYIKITEINPNNSFAFKKIGYLQMQLGNTEAAVNAYGRAIDLDPKDAVTYNNRAYLYQINKNYPKAIADYTKAIELDRKYISAYVNRGITQAGINNFKAAKNDFEICVQLDPNAGELRRFLGLAKLSLNDKAGACADFEKASVLGDKQAEELAEKNCK
jgi:tetratricopeptide (TPR) repeat protein